MTKDEALKMAIEALENIHNRLIATDRRGLRYDEAEALDACKEALKQPAQEPVGEYQIDGSVKWYTDVMPYKAKLYTHPHQWQGLTADEIASIPLDEHTVQTVEKILKEKNT